MKKQIKCDENNFPGVFTDELSILIALHKKLSLAFLLPTKTRLDFVSSKKNWLLRVTHLLLNKFVIIIKIAPNEWLAYQRQIDVFSLPRMRKRFSQFHSSLNLFTPTLLPTCHKFLAACSGSSQRARSTTGIEKRNWKRKYWWLRRHRLWVEQWWVRKLTLNFYWIFVAFSSFRNLDRSLN